MSEVKNEAPVQPIQPTQTTGLTTDITKQLLGTVLSTRMIQDIGSIFSSSTGGTSLSVKNIAQLLLLMSLDEIKVIISSAITAVKTYVVAHGVKFLSIASIGVFFQFIRKALVWMFRQLTLQWLYARIRPAVVPDLQMIAINSNDESDAEVRFEPTVPLMQAMVVFIKNNPEACEVTISNKSGVKVMNLDESVLTETWDRVRIKYNDCIIRFNAQLCMTFMRKQGHDAVLQNWSVIPPSSNIRRFSDLLPESTIRTFIRSTIDRFTDKTRPYKVQIPGMPHDVYTYDPTLKVTSNVTAELALVYAHVRNFPTMDINISHYEYALLQNLYSKYGFGHVMTLCTYRLFGHTIFITDDESKTILEVSSRSHYLYGKFETAFANLNIAYPTLTANELEMYKDGFVMNGSAKTKNDIIPVHITSQEPLTPIEMSQRFDAFISHLGSCDFSATGKTVKIFNVKISRKENEVEIPNPAFKEWKARTSNKDDTTEVHEQVEEDGDKNGGTGEKKKKSRKKRGGAWSWGGGSFYDPPPASTIIKTEVTKSVIVELVNEKSKPLNTLYMRKNDMFKLKNCVESFANRQELLSNLGLPNKLGILLYGKPGTGKSSAILAVATHMKKDIYYVHLNCVQSNDELQMIFDHVNKQCLNGGIIIFEDIDAMTTVVHKRSSSPIDSSYTDVGSVVGSVAGSALGSTVGSTTGSTTSPVGSIIGSNVGSSASSEKSVSLVDLLNQQDSQLTLEYFLNVLQGSLTQDGTIFIATTNHLENLDPAFYRDGRFDVRIEMKMCDRFQINTIYSQLMMRPIPNHLLERIPEDKYTPANIIFHIKPYMFGDYTDEEVLAPFISASINDT